MSLFREKYYLWENFFENQSGYSCRTSAVSYAEMLATDIKMNDETNEF